MREKLYTYKAISEFISNLGYILINCNEGVFGEVIFRDKDGYILTTINRRLFKNQDIEKFHTSNPYTIQNIKLWCQLNNKPFELLSDIYEGNSKKLQWKCLKIGCEEIFEMHWGNILSNKGCSYCSGKQVGLSNCLATLNPDLAKEWHPTLNGDLTPFDVTCNTHKKVWWQCKNNPKHIWRINISNRNNGACCPKCSESKGETKISQYFIENNIFNISQKEFNGLTGIKNGNLSYDFYLPQFNLLIEYQGEFHDGNGNYYMKRNLKRQQEHDKRKKEYADKNDIKLLEIWYWDFDNIEEILNKELKLNNYNIVS